MKKLLSAFVVFGIMLTTHYTVKAIDEGNPPDKPRSPIGPPPPPIQ